MGKFFGLSCIKNFTIAELEEAMTKEGFEVIETHTYFPKPPRLFAVAKKPGFIKSCLEKYCSSLSQRILEKSPSF